MASNAADAGLPDRMIQQIGNWKDARMLARYRHLADEQVREAAGRVAARIAGGHTLVTTEGAATDNKKATSKKVAS